MLTPRQEVILRKVAESYAATGQPVASRALAADPAFVWGPSTIRSELAELEAQGLLAHPAHLRRAHADRRRPALPRRPAARDARPERGRRRSFDLTQVRREIDDALRVTTESLSEITNLLAVATAPALDSATIRHIEVLTLQPSVVLVVIISSAGGVSKFVCAFDEAVDPGLVAWAGEYLNERVGGLPLGSRMLLGRLADPELTARERALRRPSRARLQRARRRRRGRAPHRRRLAPARRSRHHRPGRGGRADGAARGARRAARGAAARARPAGHLRAHRRRERRARGCSRSRSSRPATGSRSAGSARCR